MGKIVATVAAIAVAVGIAVFAPQLAPLLLAALGTSSATALALAAATAVIAATLAVAGSFLISALAPKPMAGRPAPINFRQSITNSWIVIGKRRVGGLMTFFHPRKVGKDHYRYFIFASAGHRCRGAVRWYLGDEVVTVDGSGQVTSGTYANNAWLWFGRGQYDVDETPAGWRSETDGKYSTDHIGYGVAKIFAKFKLTDSVVEAGMPTISAEVEGSDEIRDPRDGSVGYTNLATPAFYWWMRLPREEGGFGAAADEIPDDDILSAWTNVCDEDVALAAGGTEKRYTFDALIETGSEPSKVRETFVTCCAGSYTYSGGVFLMRPGYWVPPTATLSEDDLAGAIKVPLLADAQRFANEVSGTYVDPESNYQPQPVPTRSIAAVDIRQADVDLAHITSHTRGQRILEIMLRRAQCEKRVTWPMNIQGLELASMQTVQLATARYGLSNYAFVIDDWQLSSSFDVALSLREENADCYHWTTAMEHSRSGVATPDVANPFQYYGAIQGAVATSYPLGLTLTAADDGTITISDHVRRYTDGYADVPITGATIDSGLEPGDFRAIGYDDGDRAGGAVTYQLFEDDLDARASPDHPERHYVGYVVIPTAGSPPASGGGAVPPGGYCVTIDTPVLLEGGGSKAAAELQVGDRLWTRHEATLRWGVYPVEAITIVDSDDVWEATVGGRVLRATGDHLVYTGGWVKMRDIGVAIPAEQLAAERAAFASIVAGAAAYVRWYEDEYLADPGKAALPVAKMTVTTAHTYVSNGILSHNLKENEPI